MFAIVMCVISAASAAAPFQLECSEVMLDQGREQRPIYLTGGLITNMPIRTSRGQAMAACEATTIHLHVPTASEDFRINAL